MVAGNRPSDDLESFHIESTNVPRGDRIDRAIAWWKRRSWFGKSVIIVGVIVAVVVARVVIFGIYGHWGGTPPLPPAQWAAAEAVSAARQTAYQQALDRTVQVLSTMNDCIVDISALCGSATEPILILERVWAYGRTLYVQARLGPWVPRTLPEVAQEEAAAHRREWAASVMLGVWGRALDAADANPGGPTAIIVLDKQRTPIVCVRDSGNPDSSVLYSCPQ